MTELSTGPPQQWLAQVQDGTPATGPSQLFTRELVFIAGGATTTNPGHLALSADGVIVSASESRRGVNLLVGLADTARKIIVVCCLGGGAAGSSGTSTINLAGCVR